MHIFIGNGGTKMVTNPGLAICCLTIFIVWGSFSQIFCHPRNWVFILIAATCITAGLLKLTMVYWFRGGYPMHIFIANGGTKMVIDSGVVIFFLTTPATSRRPGRIPLLIGKKNLSAMTHSFLTRPVRRTEMYFNVDEKVMFAFTNAE